jgi:hypothetical protein
MSTSEIEPLEPAALAIRRVRRMMVISGATTLFAAALILMLVGYRVFQRGEQMAPPDVTAVIPSGGRIVSTAVADDRVVVTIEVGGAIEIRSFDLHSLKPAGRLKFSTGQ